MNNYPSAVFQHLANLVQSESEHDRRYLLDNSCRELVEFWDAYEGIEASFKWLMENDNYPLAAAVDALNGRDQAKAWLLSNGHRELAAFVDACDGNKTAVAWLMRFQYKGWVLVAREINLRIRQEKKNSIWSFLNFGNPFS